MYGPVSLPSFGQSGTVDLVPLSKLQNQVLCDLVSLRAFWEASPHYLCFAQSTSVYVSLPSEFFHKSTSIVKDILKPSLGLTPSTSNRSRGGKQLISEAFHRMLSKRSHRLLSLHDLASRP